MRPSFVRVGATIILPPAGAGGCKCDCTPPAAQFTNERLQYSPSNSWQISCGLDDRKPSTWLLCRPAFINPTRNGQLVHPAFERTRWRGTLRCSPRLPSHSATSRMAYRRAFSRPTASLANGGSDYNPQMAATDGASQREKLDIRLVVDTIPTLAWSSHPDGTVDFVNQRWREYTGLSAEESYGCGWRTAIHPDDLPVLSAKWEATYDAGDARQCELRLRRSDGVFRWFSFRREPQSNGTAALLRWYGTAVDIEDRKQFETILAAENRTLQMIANGANLTVVLDDLCAAIDAHTS